MTGKSSRVRPYTVTRGRTRTRHPLLLETLISVYGYDSRSCAELTPESQEIYMLCRETRSVVEISTQLQMPVGVVRVLVSDLADQGMVQVHPTGYGADSLGTELLERVLRGLQTLPR